MVHARLIKMQILLLFSYKTNNTLETEWKEPPATLNTEFLYSMDFKNMILGI